MQPNQIIGIAGALTIASGCFSPVITSSFGRAQTFVGMYDFAGEAIVVLALVSMALAIANQCRWIWIPAIGSLASLAFTFYEFWERTSEALNDLTSNGGALGAYFSQSISIGYGWLVLLVGVFMLIVSVALPSKKQRQIQL